MQAQNRSPHRPISPGCTWSLGGAVLGLLLLIAALALGRMRGARLSAQILPEPVFTVIPMPSATRVAIVGTSEPPEMPEATNTVPPADPELALGALVEIFGTGGDGLRLRERPGLQAPVKFLGLEHEVFEVRDGPVDQDGFNWWLLHNPYDETIFGWAVGRYLRVLES